MAGSIRDGKILKGQEAIMAWLDVSDTVFKKFVGMGMPVKVVFGTYWAHKDNLEKFFQVITIPQGPQRAVEESRQES